MPQPKKQPPKLFEPWAPPKPELPDVVALKALAQGNATSDQQTRALKFIVEKIAGTYEEVYCPGADGDRNTAYALGKRRVGTYIVSLLNADIRKFKEDGQPSEQVE